MKINEELYNKWLNDKYVVAVRTQEEYKQFMRWLEDNTNIKWHSGDKPSRFICWESHKEKSCIANEHPNCPDGLSLGAEEYNKEQGYQVIEFKDLREMLKVGYRVISTNVLGNDVDVVTQSFHQEIYLRDLDSNLVSKEDSRLYITKIYRPKYNGIKSIGKPEWELVWERKEELYTLQCPLTKELLCKVLIGDLCWDVTYTIRKQNTFTQQEIDNLPNQEYIKTLDKKLYEETK